METSVPNVYACGDCAEFNGANYAVWPEASEQGRIAGANAAGDQIVYAATAPTIDIPWDEHGSFRSRR